MILVIDNYDSFTYNLVQYIGETGAEVRTCRNDQIKSEDINLLNPSSIILSPGPGIPQNSGVCPDIIRNHGENIPILGVCLGHQAVAYVYGSDIRKCTELVHGKTSQVFHDGLNIYANIKNPFTAARYHSLIVDSNSIPDCLEITAETEDGIVMGIRHKDFPVEGVQFHPESILTTEGRKLLLNFLNCYN